MSLKCGPAETSGKPSRSTRTICSVIHTVIRATSSDPTGSYPPEKSNRHALNSFWWHATLRPPPGERTWLSVGARCPTFGMHTNRDDPSSSRLLVFSVTPSRPACVAVESRPMPKKKRAGPSAKVLAVLRSSPNLEPCPKFRRVDIKKFFAHLRDDRCEVCLAFIRQLNHESNLICMLAGSKN